MTRITITLVDVDLATHASKPGQTITNEFHRNDSIIQNTTGTVRTRITHTNIFDSFAVFPARCQFANTNVATRYVRIVYATFDVSRNTGTAIALFFVHFTVRPEPAVSAVALVARPAPEVFYGTNAVVQARFARAVIDGVVALQSGEHARRVAEAFPAAWF